MMPTKRSSRNETVLLGAFLLIPLILLGIVIIRGLT